MSGTRRRSNLRDQACCQTSTWREAELLLAPAREAASTRALPAPDFSAAREVDGVIGVLSAVAVMFEVERLGPEADRTD